MDTDQDDTATGSMALRFGSWLRAGSPPRVSTRPSTNDSTRAAKQRPGGNNECVPEAGRGAADNPRAGSCDVALVGLESKDQTTGLPLQHAEVQDVGQGSGIGRGGGLGSTKEFHKVSPTTTKVNPPVSSLFFFGSSDLNDECLGDSGLSTTQKGKSVGNSSLVESDDSTLTSFVRKATWKRRARKSNDSQLVEVEMEDNGPHKRGANSEDDSLLTAGQVKWGRRFHFESSWADEEECHDIIRSQWEIPKAGSLREVVAWKIQDCATSLNSWSRITLHKLRREIART
ncbi:hypothetical protein ACOSQ2_018333 [Xanthoceras sorbifolium]